MIRLIAHSILSRRANFLGALAAVTFFTALTVSTINLIVSANTSRLPSERLAAVDVMVAFDPYGGDQEIPSPLNAGHIDRIRALDGVAAVIPDTRFPAQLLDAEGVPISFDDADHTGQPWSATALTPYVLASGTAPAAPDEIALDAATAEDLGLTPGATVEVLTTDLPATYVVTGIVTPERGNAIDGQRTIFFTDAHAAAATPTSIGVIATDGADLEDLADRIAEVTAGTAADVLTGNDISRADPASQQELVVELAALVGTMSGFSGFVAIFVLGGTFTFSILQRHREIGLQRAIGATPRQIQRMIAGEALALAVAGTLLGLLPGALLARGIVWYTDRKGMVPDGFEVQFPWWSVAATLAIAIVLVQLAVFGASRRAARIRPLEALREASVPVRRMGFVRLLIGFGTMAGAFVLLALSPSMSIDAGVAFALLQAIVMLIGVALLGPLLVRPFTAVLGRLLHWLVPVGGELGWRNSRQFPARVASVSSPLVLTIGFAMLMFLFNGTMQRATTIQSEDRTTADIVLVATGDGLPLPLLQALREVPGVAAVAGTVPGMAIERNLVDGSLETEEFPAVGVDPATVGTTLDLDIVSGSLDAFDGDHLVLSEYASQGLNADVGETATISLEDGTSLSLPVAAVFRNSLGFGDVLLETSVLAPHVPVPLADTAYVRLAEGANRAEVEAALSSLPDASLFAPLSPAEYVDGIEQSAVDGAWAVYLVIGVAVFFAGLAVVNTMMMSTADRRREFALLRLVGATPNQVMSMMVAEAAIVLTIGLIIGSAIGLVSVGSASMALVGDLSAIGVPLLQVAGTVLVATVLAIGSHWLPAKQALALDPVAQIGIRE